MHMLLALLALLGGRLARGGCETPRALSARLLSDRKPLRAKGGGCLLPS